MKTAFVIMGFADQYDAVLSEAIRPALTRLGYAESMRADDLNRPGSIPDEVIRGIINADIVIADLSSGSANVYYELGIAHCVGNKTLILVADDKEVPFDLRTTRMIRYGAHKQGLFLLQHQIREMVKALEEHPPHVANNLVQEAGKHYFDLRAQVREGLTAIHVERERLVRLGDYLELIKGGGQHDNRGVADAIVAKLSRARVVPDHRPTFVSICGAGAIGKSTFAKLLRNRLSEVRPDLVAEVLETDCYLLNREERIAKNVLGYSPETHDLDRFVRDIETLWNGGTIEVHRYDHGTGTHESQPRTIGRCDVLILEGVQSLYPRILPYNRDFKYFIYAGEEQAKEMKILADIRHRGYDIQTALRSADPLYRSYAEHILPLMRVADHVIAVDQYWRYKGAAE
jgi:uridine kinase